MQLSAVFFKLIIAEIDNAYLDLRESINGLNLNTVCQLG